MIRRFTLLLGVAVLALKADAQPILHNGIPPLGFSTEAYTGDTTNPGNAGSNITWDFSGLDVNYAAGVSVVAPGTTPYISRFSASNFALKLSVSSFGFYNYYHTDATKLEVMGTGIGGLTENDYSADFRLWLKFPFSYHDTAMDTWRYNGTKYVDSIVYDAYGTLITPFDTFVNAVRTKTVTRDSTGLAVNITYTWFASDSLFELLAIDSFQTLLIKSTPKPPPIGIHKLSANNYVKIFPNPAAKVVNVDAGNLRGTFLLYDMSGKLIREETMVNQLTQISLDGIHAGLYYYSIISAGIGQKFTGKLIVNP